MTELTARPWLAGLAPYRPGAAAPSAAGSLSSNESALGASPHVVDAVTRAARAAHRYPDALATDLRAEIAARHGVPAEQVLVGNGSDELIFLLALAFLAGGGTAVCADPAYRVDEISTQVVGGTVTSVPLVADRHDLPAMAAVPADIAYVVNPHNPTGTLVPRDAIRRFRADSPAGLVVVDEAYVDFAPDPLATTAVPLVREGGLAVLRTFSKAYGLAGLRVGYLVAPASVVATLSGIRAPFSVNRLAQAAALAALRDRTHHEAVRVHTIDMRRRVSDLFTHHGYDVVPSHANFVLVRVPDEAAAVRRLADAGIAVRPGSALGVPGAIRVSVPGDEGWRQLRQALSRP
ncbi:aminotransferase class I/II-fold pyridoxal phosphate-dependent enzyme [Pimelobacter simplex]|uniref:Histidinol-phosphate aminotransferase n=1 Tax=Nocardioides simplex TaxID=2045 RepID=A0A0C5XHC7_NOCSI|nr:histidinol-phosphate transaminase [Pimelobacter simplex]AJR18546.1 Histidinol-phosphate aminotransferase [Pimelobacter simplex]MCG8153690.1 aminotransferase class I/II-fold pyridoxal phosphate-dependent enzyme [Pimelobacter simplex]GEB15647.1 histidinol-phosphate aminotransferase [Pimelobacter simplex]SFN08722.1 histidinol-phosphate aminotransferase [Pimelobacter simplex]